MDLMRADAPVFVPCSDAPSAESQAEAAPLSSDCIAAASGDLLIQRLADALGPAQKADSRPNAARGPMVETRRRRVSCEPLKILPNSLFCPYCREGGHCVFHTSSRAGPQPAWPTSPSEVPLPAAREATSQNKENESPRRRAAPARLPLTELIDVPKNPPAKTVSLAAAVLPTISTGLHTGAWPCLPRVQDKKADQEDADASSTELGSADADRICESLDEHRCDESDRSSNASIHGPVGAPKKRPEGRGNKPRAVVRQPLLLSLHVQD